MQKFDGSKVMNIGAIFSIFKDAETFLSKMEFDRLRTFWWLYQYFSLSSDINITKQSTL